MNKAIQRLKEQAAKLGANGILLRGAGDQYGGTVSSGSATAIANGNSATAFGTGVSAPIIHKSAAGIAIYVSAENAPLTPKERGPMEQLRMLKQLLNEGIITRDEFEARKKKILDGQ